jgi:putative chitinase
MQMPPDPKAPSSVEESERQTFDLEARRLSLEERKLDLEVGKFELDRAKYRDNGFVNRNFAVIITAMIGAGTIGVSYFQLQNSREMSKTQLELQRRTSDAELKLEQEKAIASKASSDRNLQLDIAKLLLEKSADLSAAEARQVPFLRDALSALPTDIGIRITRKLADSAPNAKIRSQWNDTYVDLKLSVATTAPEGAGSIITIESIIKSFPKLNAVDKRARLVELLDAAKEFGLNDLDSVKYLLVVVFWQTDFFNSVEENLNYSARRLMAVFPSRFPDIADALKFEKNPELLANALYGGRLGNDIQGDGWKYRGRGYLYTTGKAKYAISSERLSIDLVGDPDQLLDSRIAAREAASFLAAIPDRQSLSSLVRRINGSNAGLAVAQSILEKLEPESPKVTQGLTIAPVSEDGK